MTVYVSWAPPDHRSLIFSDSSDGLPLMVIVDGDSWLYDLVGGQIVHFKSEPKLEIRANKDGALFSWGIAPPGQNGGIHVDLGSLLKSPYISELKAVMGGSGRTVMATTAHGSEAILNATSSDPPLPVRLILEFPLDAARGRVECDDFHFGEPLPSWHHTLDTSSLRKDVPYLDAADVKDAPKDEEEFLEVTKGLLAGATTFLIRPAIREMDLRRKLEGTLSKLDFRQLELHEKLLKNAWLRALERQKCEPGKFSSSAPILSGD